MNELALIDSEIKDQNEIIKQLNEEIKNSKKRNLTINNIEEYFDVIKEYIELDLILTTINKKFHERKNLIKMSIKYKTKNEELKKELNNIVNDIKKEDEDINKLNKKINNLKDNTQMYLKIIPEYIELKEKKKKYILLEKLITQILELEKQKNNLKLEYELEKFYCDLKNEKVEKINHLIQTFIDYINNIQHYFDIIKTYVENDQELKNLNNRLSKLRKYP